MYLHIALACYGIYIFLNIARPVASSRTWGKTPLILKCGLLRELPGCVATNVLECRVTFFSLFSSSIVAFYFFYCFHFFGIPSTCFMQPVQQRICSQSLSATCLYYCYRDCYVNATVPDNCVWALASHASFKCPVLTALNWLTHYPNWTQAITTVFRQVWLWIWQYKENISPFHTLPYLTREPWSFRLWLGLGSGRCKWVGNLFFLIFFISNGRYIDCLSLIYATNKSRELKLHYKYYIKRGKT